ncbi:MAG: tRNA (N(6)-L-threonylcarbamoyladenosine(37)-C(2))-methylthiotransferase MtaB [Candidatus Aminicenantaceae bacterium]
MRNFSIKSFGCRVNQAEAFVWSEEFQKHGLKLEKDFSKSDLVVVNSCTLTSRADRDVRKFIGKVSRENPEARIILTGCYVERRDRDVNELASLWHVFSNSEKKNLTSRVLSSVSKKKKSSFSNFRSRALVKIQDGCDFRCSFCVIPNVRGNSISYGKKTIMDRIKQFISRGFKEIVLTGIHICSYGNDFIPKSSFLDLLSDMEQIQNLERIRLSSLDPRFLDSSILDFFSKSRKICPHFHLSLQHGSDSIIKSMGRNIRTSDYKKVIHYLHNKIPDASLGADIIAGFPGESEKDFRKTYQFLERSPLSYFHVFSYSPRSGTAAASWPQVKSKIKSERASLLRELAKKKNMGFRQRFVGKVRNAVVIKKRKDSAEVLTDNYIRVSVPVCHSLEKENVKVKIREVDRKETKGEAH